MTRAKSWVRRASFTAISLIARKRVLRSELIEGRLIFDLGGGFCGEQIKLLSANLMAESSRLPR